MTANNPKTFHHKKKFGQNFLSDKNIIKKIVAQANLNENEAVWEIGPGLGILTEEILKFTNDLTVFEIDRELYPHLETKFADKIKLVKADVLRTDWSELLSQKTKIIANIPYQITSPLLFRISEHADFFSKIVLMMQKEVADRITASRGTKDYGALTLKMNYHFVPQKLFTVKPHLFYPPPKVESTVIEFIPRKDKPSIENIEAYWKLIEFCFRNRRKMLRRNLRTLFPDTSSEVFETLTSIDLSRRGETLSEEEFIILHNSLSSI
ncbi:MAG: 16S rRNA (adenine(1518)-N(6)/adenine(1519)-N(6))-dimethyltransferase RsmA [Candidatus Cloacimonetes bacterium]|nr:16S rRNA (adenine(1518)-N(6)/adenine(1519)-N(6))-dimethyltransferase RsmA [Candidatus Cloacimonadota bacterium]